MKRVLWVCLLALLCWGGAVQASLIMVSQNPQVSPGLVTYRSAASLPTPHQAGGPAARGSFNYADSIRAALQISLPDITSADFDNPGDADAKARNELLWQVAWIDPYDIHVYTDTVVLCWDSAVEACDASAIEIKPLVDAALSSPLNPQALALATGNGIHGALPGFEHGTWEVRAFFDGTGLDDYFTRTTFVVSAPSAGLLLLLGVAIWRLRSAKDA